MVLCISFAMLRARSFRMVRRRLQNLGLLRRGGRTTLSVPMLPGARGQRDDGQRLQPDRRRRLGSMVRPRGSQCRWAATTVGRPGRGVAEPAAGARAAGAEI